MQIECVIMHSNLYIPIFPHIPMYLYSVFIPTFLYASLYILILQFPYIPPTNISVYSCIPTRTPHLYSYIPINTYAPGSAITPAYRLAVERNHRIRIYVDATLRSRCNGWRGSVPCLGDMALFLAERHIGHPVWQSLRIDLRLTVPLE